MVSEATRSSLWGYKFPGGACPQTPLVLRGYAHYCSKFWSKVGQNTCKLLPPGLVCVCVCVWMCVYMYLLPCKLLHTSFARWKQGAIKLSVSFSMQVLCGFRWKHFVQCRVLPSLTLWLDTVTVEWCVHGRSRWSLFKNSTDMIKHEWLLAYNTATCIENPTQRIF